MQAMLFTTYAQFVYVSFISFWISFLKSFGSLINELNKNVTHDHYLFL
jgi:hypothetical protein